MTRIFTWSCCVLSLLWRLGGPAVRDIYVILLSAVTAVTSGWASSEGYLRDPVVCCHCCDVWVGQQWGIFTWSCCLLSLLWRLGGPTVSQRSCPGLPGYRSNHYWLLQNQSLIHCFSEVSSSKVLVLWQFYVRMCILFYREEIHFVCLSVCFEVVTSINTKFTWFINIYMFTFG